jgi:hypothetical protein
VLEFKVLESHLRPAMKDKCLYCKSKVGGYHLDTCVFICKKVKVRCTIEYEISCPYHWTKHDIEFHRNEGSWCSDNMLNELENLSEKNGCLCYFASYEVIDNLEDKEPFIEEDK